MGLIQQKRSDGTRYHVKLHKTIDLLNDLYVCSKSSKNLQDIIAPSPGPSGPSHYSFFYTSFGTSINSLSSLSVMLPLMYLLSF